MENLPVTEPDPEGEASLRRTQRQEERRGANSLQRTEWQS